MNSDERLANANTGHISFVEATEGTAKHQVTGEPRSELRSDYLRPQTVIDLKSGWRCLAGNALVRGSCGPLITGVRDEREGVYLNRTGHVPPSLAE